MTPVLETQSGRWWERAGVPRPLRRWGNRGRGVLGRGRVHAGQAQMSEGFLSSHFLDEAAQDESESGKLGL